MPVDVSCENCGDVFECPKHRAEKRDNLFCCRDCYHDFGRPDMQGENHHDHKGGKKEQECEWCGETYMAWPYEIENGRRFCGRECSDKAQAEVKGPKHPRYKPEKHKTFQCKNCGDEFRRYAPKNDCEYCTEECYREAAKDLFAGKKNPVWRGGWTHYYGANWDEQREKALERDNHTCQDCGKHADDMPRSPDVHHKKRLGWFKEEYDEPRWWQEGNKVENLVTLCPKCHKVREFGD